MGTWISHLRIAESLLEALPGLDAAAFSYGSLAPDSGMPNEDWSVFDPSKEVTHFVAPGAEESAIADLEFYRRYLQGLTPGHAPARHSFLLAYFFHLVCDSLWAWRIGERCKQAYAGLIAERGNEAWWTMKKDWYDLDHRYLRDHPHSLFWKVLLPAPEPQRYLDFLSEAAVRHQMAYIKKFYSETRDRQLDRPYPYLNEMTMARYAEDSVQALLLIHRAHDGPIPPGEASALCFLAAVDKAAYEPPIGDAA